LVYFAGIFGAWLVYLDRTQCECSSNTFYYAVNQGGGALLCVACPTTYVRVRELL
jgi:hypothetical protein